MFVTPKLGAVSEQELRRKLSAILDRVENGECFHITRNGRIIGRLVPEPGKSFIGATAGGPSLPDDFNSPTDELNW